MGRVRQPGLWDLDDNLSADHESAELRVRESGIPARTPLSLSIQMQYDRVFPVAMSGSCRSHPFFAPHRTDAEIPDIAHNGSARVIRDSVDHSAQHPAASRARPASSARPEMSYTALTVPHMLRPASWTKTAGGSPVPVSTGAPGSRPRFVGETGGLSGVSRASSEGASARAVASSELCSLVTPTTEEPSRSCHGEGHVRRALVRGQLVGSSRGTGAARATVWFGTGESRLPGLRRAKTRGISRW